MKFRIVAMAMLAVSVASAEILVTVDAADEVGPIKIMNAVNNGPVAPAGVRQHSNFDAFKAARIPFGRTHDTSEYIVFVPGSYMSGVRQIAATVSRRVSSSLPFPAKSLLGMDQVGSYSCFSVFSQGLKYRGSGGKPP